MKQPRIRIECGTSHISPDDLRKWGELKGSVAWSIISFAETGCRTKRDRLSLLKLFAEDIIEKCRAVSISKNPQPGLERA
jgi:hypothetical protein